MGTVFKGKWMKTIDIAIKEINITKNELKVANKEIIGMAIWRHPRIISFYFFVFFHWMNELNFRFVWCFITWILGENDLFYSFRISWNEFRELYFKLKNPKNFKLESANFDKNFRGISLFAFLKCSPLWFKTKKYFIGF